MFFSLGNFHSISSTIAYPVKTTGMNIQMNPLMAESVAALAPDLDSPGLIFG